jgi:intein/homing endonuclease
MLGQGVLGSKVLKALPGIARKLERLTLRGMARVYQDAAKREAGNLVGSKLGDLRAVSRAARRDAFRDYRRVISSYREHSNRVDYFLTKSKHPVAQLNRVAGRLFNPNKQPLTSYIKQYIVNDLATMPIMYGMYRHDRSQYPEMHDTSFASYYFQTLPFSIGFSAATQAFRMAGKRHINQKLVRYLRHSGMGVSLVKSVLAFQDRIARQVEDITAGVRYVRREMTKNMLPEDLLTIKGLKDFGTKFDRAFTQALQGARIRKDTDMELIRASVNTLIDQGVKTEEAMKIGYDLNSSIIRKKEIIHKWIETITTPDSVKYNVTNMFVGSGNKSGFMTDIITDRSEIVFNNKVYKTFSPNKFIDNMVTKLIDHHINIGPGSVLRIGRIITAAFKPFASNFSKSLSSTIIGTGLPDSGLKTGGVIASITNNIVLSMGGATRAIGHEEQTSVVKRALGELFGSPKLSQEEKEKIGERIFAEMMISANKNNEEVFGPYLFRRMVDDMLPTASGDIFHVDADGIISFIPKGSNTSFKMLGAGKFTHFTREGKSVQAEAMNRMSGGIITNYTHLKTAEDRAIEAINRNKKPEISLLHYLQDRFELGGGGVKSAVDYVGGFFRKFFDSTSAHNLFHKENLKRTLQGLKAANIDKADAFARTFNNMVSNSQERLFRFISRNGSKYDELINAMNGFYISFGQNKRASLDAMTLVNAQDRTDAIKRLDLFYEVVESIDKDNPILDTLSSIRSALLESGTDFKSILKIVNYDLGVTIGEKYESMLFNVFIRSNNDPTAAITHAAATARKWIPSSKLTNLETWKTIMQTVVSGDKYLALRTDKNNVLDIYRDEVVNILKANVPAATGIGEMLEGKNWWLGSGGKMERYIYHKHSTSTLYAVPEVGAFSPGLKRINYLDANFVERQAEVMTNAVNSASLLTFASFNTANKVMGLLGLGIDKYRSTEQIIGGLIKKRVLPLAAATITYSVADDFFDRSPLFEGSPLDEGLTVFAANIYARAKISSAGILDAIGVTQAAKYLEDLMPGTINSPLSGILRGPVPLMIGPAYGFMKGGMRGAITGGIIGSSISLLLGGFGLSVFDDWDISKSRAEVISELKGETEVKISSGRFWELCLVAGQLVRTKRGLIPIEQIVVGDMVMTHRNRWKMVSDISNRTDKRIHTIRMNGLHGLPIRLTENHPLFVKNKQSGVWKEAKDIVEGDELLYPMNEQLVDKIFISNYLNGYDILSTAESPTRHRYRYLYRNKNGMLQYTGSDGIVVGKDGILHLGEDLGYLFGVYLGDGNLFMNTDGRPGGIEFAFSSYQTESLERCRSILLERFGIETEKDSKGNMLRLRVINRVLGILFYQIFGKEKIPPTWMYSATSAFELGIVAGLIDSDGHISTPTTGKNKGLIRVTFTNTNINIIHLYYTILSEHHIKANIIENKTPINNGYKASYIISTNTGESLTLCKIIKAFKLERVRKQFGVKVIEKNEIRRIPDVIINGIKYLIRTVKSNEVENNKKPIKVYDICVPGDHSFAGFGIVFHNSSGSFWGNKTAYYRPHMYHLLKSDYTDSPNFKTSLINEIASYIDPAVYNRIHYWSRPSLEHPGMLSNLPFIGPLIQLPGTTAHSEYWEKTSSQSFLDEITETRSMIRNSKNISLVDQLGLASGMGGSSSMIESLMPDPRSSSSIETRMSETFYNLKELAGLRGFLTEQMQYALTGETQMFSEVPVIEAPNIGSISRSFWGLELGGGVGLTEPIRRIFPRKTKEIQYFNPVPNLMPAWLPGKDYFIDFRTGDPYSKIQMGEIRLPGESYEAVKDVRHTFPGNSDLLGLDIDSAIQSYAGNPEYLISRYQAMDSIQNMKERIIEGVRAEGALLREKSVVYDPDADLTAQADILIHSPETGEVIPVKFVPYLRNQKGFLAGSAESLNAYLVLSGYKRGKLVGIDEEGETTETVIYASEELYRQNLATDIRARRQAITELIRRRESGLPVASGSSYSHIDRLKILADVAYHSDEYKTELAIVKARIKAGKEPAAAEEIVARIEEQVEKLKNNRDFMPERFLSSFSTPLTEQAVAQKKYITQNYSIPERLIGGAWEYLSTLRNPLIRKLIGNRTALQAYEEDVVYGRSFKVWQEPIDSYVKPFINLQLQETDPLQSTLSGATAGFIFGGGFGAIAGGAGSALWSLTGAHFMNGYIPEETRIKREIMAAADIAEEQRYSMLYDLTGSEEYKFRMRNTISNALRTNQIITQSRLRNLSNKPEKEYINAILNNLNTGNLDRVRAMLPENITALLNQSMGIITNIEPEEYAGDFVVAPKDVTNITQPIEDIVVRTFEREGLSAKDVGLGWYKTMARMSALQRMGLHIPAMESRNKLEMIRDTKQYIDPSQIKKTLNRILLGEATSITVVNNDGPLEVVVEII